MWITPFTGRTDHGNMVPSSIQKLKRKAMNFFLSRQIGFPPVFHKIITMYRLNISTRYIVLAITDLSTVNVDKFSTLSTFFLCNIAVRYINALYSSRHSHNLSRSMRLSTFVVDKFSTFYPHRGFDIAAQYINALYYTGNSRLIHTKCG